MARLASQLAFRMGISSLPSKDGISGLFSHLSGTFVGSRNPDSRSVLVQKLLQLLGHLPAPDQLVCVSLSSMEVRGQHWESSFVPLHLFVCLFVCVF